MKQCPNCGEFVGDKVDTCFNCRYNFLLGQVVSNKPNSENAKTESPKDTAGNTRYIYEVCAINDLHTGEANCIEIQKKITDYASKGWRLHSITTNEIGKESVGVTVSFLGRNINATIDQTILVFEKCITL